MANSSESVESVYLDYNATTPLDPEVGEAMLPFLKSCWGNPSSMHPHGILAKKAVENSRQQIAKMLEVDPDEIIFTSGGTESNNYAIKGAAFARRSSGTHIITSSVEHPAVMETVGWLETQGFRVTYLPVDEFGMVLLDELKAAIRSDTILVTVMHANNEVGTLQPIAELAAVARASGILFHTDAAQSVGKVVVTVPSLGVDMLTIAGHKLYAPKGVGALYVRRGTKLERFMHGAPHESGRRAGTENVMQVVGLGKACELISSMPLIHFNHLSMLRDRLLKGLKQSISSSVLKVNGHPENVLPNTLSVCFRGVEANTLLSEIADRVSASAGAACHSDRIDISHVLSAMGVPNEWAMGTVRLSVGRFSTEKEIDYALSVIIPAVQRLMPKEETGIDVLSELKEGETVKLTRYTHGLGCACKLRPQALEQVLSVLSPMHDPNVLVGNETADDAAVYKITEDIALVATDDFFTPIVDDPYQFGAISAANSLSDVYAMGGKPLFALSIVGFPSTRLPLTVLQQILLGAQDKAAEAGISIVGGHTVDDTEPKFGLAVVGIVHPKKIIPNNGVRHGDLLLLTKPIGLGISTTAMKRGLAPVELEMEAIRVMSSLNRHACEAMVEVGVNACTDITGFGLLGHLLEMAVSSKVDIEIDFNQVPMLPGVRALAAQGIVPGGTLANLHHVSSHVSFPEKLSDVDRLLLADAQTSGGLLLAVSEDKLDVLKKSLDNHGLPDVSVVGRAVRGVGKISIKL